MWWNVGYSGQQMEKVRVILVFSLVNSSDCSHCFPAFGFSGLGECDYEFDHCYFRNFSRLFSWDTYNEISWEMSWIPILIDY